MNMEEGGGRQGRGHGDDEQGVKAARDSDPPRRSVEILSDLGLSNARQSCTTVAFRRRAYELRVATAGVKKASRIPGDGIAMPIRPAATALSPALAQRAATSASSGLKDGAKAVADHTSSSSAAYRTGAGSTSKRRHGAIAEDGLPAGPTLWRQLDFGRRASCLQRRTWTAIRPTIG